MGALEVDIRRIGASYLPGRDWKIHTVHRGYPGLSLPGSAISHSDLGTTPHNLLVPLPEGTGVLTSAHRLRS